MCFFKICIENVSYVSEDSPRCFLGFWAMYPYVSYSCVSYKKACSRPVFHGLSTCMSWFIIMLEMVYHHVCGEDHRACIGDHHNGNGYHHNGNGYHNNGNGSRPLGFYLGMTHKSILSQKMSFDVTQRCLGN